MLKRCFNFKMWSGILEEEKKVLYKVWLKESTCWHAAFRDQVIQSLLFTQKEVEGRGSPFTQPERQVSLHMTVIGKNKTEKVVY